MARVLAIESDLRQASILKRIVKDKVHADLVVVDSRDAAIASITASIPDVILVTALLSPRDEEDLIAHLRTLDGADHVQLHTIPQLASVRGDDDDAAGGLFGKLKKKKDQPIPGCDPDLFADEIRTFLDHAEQAKAAATANVHRRKLFDGSRPAASDRSGDPHGSSRFADFNSDAGGEQASDPGLPLDEGVIGGSTAGSAWASPFEWRPSGSSAKPAAAARPQQPPSLVTNVPLAVVADQALEQAQREQEERRRREAAEREEQERLRQEAAARAEEERARKEAVRAEEEERKRKEAARAAEEERKRKEAAARAAEEERKRKEAAARAAEEERKRKEAEARALEAERRRKEAEARAAEEERKRKEAAARAEEEARKRREAEARAAEEERKRKEAAARAAEEERKRKEAAARAEEERKRKEAEARAADAERKRKEAEARAAEEERKRREAEARAAEEERKRKEAAARAEEEARKRRAEALARAEEEARRKREEEQRKREEAAARAEEEARQRREAERVRLEIEAAAARQRAEEERQRKEAAAREAERLRLEAEAAAARKRTEATVRKVTKKPKTDSGQPALVATATRIVPSEFAEFSEEHEKLQAGILGLDRLDAWARRDRRGATADQEAIEKDELTELFAGLTIPAHVATIGYTGGCRIRRVRVPPDPSAKPAGKKGLPVILSRRALDDMRSPGR